MDQIPLELPHQPVDLVAYVDGGSRGNPGEAGFGIVLQKPSGEGVRKVQGYLGTGTNNVAEYRALLVALETALQMGCKRLKVFSDSQLVVSQIQGFYRVTAPHLVPLFEEVRRLIGSFSSFRISHIPREKNGEADRLANAAIDQKTPWP